MNWGAGRYEDVAPELLPVARRVVEAAGIGAGERVVDVGCGTGNAALLAAEAGANVTGVDPAARLLEVAAERAAADGLQARFLEGDAAALPLDDGVADAVVSNFGVIFAPDAEAAAAEVARVTGAEGRFVFSAWKPGSAIGRVAGLRGEALAAAAGKTVPPRFAWHEVDAVTELLGPHGFSISATHDRISFTATSAEEFEAREYEVHPMWAVADQVLGPRGELDELRERTLEVFRDANEDPSAFRVSSEYAIVSARRR
jgi:SAM-dependent methyltransferase